jgi:glycosyltransferase involved in cell wall biosynthesis
MKVLMYGWEFPPRISGGLGTACYAIVKELAKKQVDLTLVLPQTSSVAPIASVNLIGCDNLMAAEDFNLDGINIKFPKIATCLYPYISAKDFKRLCSNETLQELFTLLDQMQLPYELKEMVIAAFEAQASGAKITGKYGFGLLVEVFRYALVAGALARNVEHSIIHAHDWLTMLAALEARRFSHKPVILHVHALETDRSGLWIDKRIFAIEKYGMDQADQIVAVSQYTKNNIVQHYGIAPEKITVIHNGAYCNDDSYIVDESRPKMVLFLGRMTQQKGPHFFIEIARRVLEKRNDVQFVLVGTGDLLRELIERTANLRIGKNVHFTGFLDSDRVKEIYKLADVYVMPSISEPFGLSALEAISYNVPSIISKQSGVSEVLRHTLVSDFWDTEDMAAKILALLEYEPLRKTSIAHEKQGLRDVTWEKTAEKIVKLYKNIILSQTKG